MERDNNGIALGVPYRVVDNCYSLDYVAAHYILPIGSVVLFSRRWNIFDKKVYDTGNGAIHCKDVVLAGNNNEDLAAILLREREHGISSE